ncbi:MAG: UDP-2,3-diacylglucosamine diphosphatase [Bacteroidales bacterium]|nr:UDP-2,3-diacylglucosamine diphosphatase [Bacteroidales bacterium]
MPEKLFTDPIVLQGDMLFVSDAHLCTPPDDASRQREESLIQLLKQHKNHLKHLFLLGDIFDFWFEYRDVVPKGYFRLFNLFYELHHNGVEIYYFTGNHDMWVLNYLTEELGVHVFNRQQAFVLNGKRCLVGHGDGLGGKQRRYRFIKWLFGLKSNYVLYSMLHPRQAFSIARHISASSRAAHKPEGLQFQKEAEFQIQYARQVMQQEQVDCFIYAHRHVPIEYKLDDNTYFFNSGDWIIHFSYITFWEESQTPVLERFIVQNK